MPFWLAASGYGLNNIPNYQNTSCIVIKTIYSSAVPTDEMLSS